MPTEVLSTIRTTESIRSNRFHLFDYNYVRFRFTIKRAVYVMFSLVIFSMLGMSLCSCENRSEHDAPIEKITSAYEKRHKNFTGNEIIETLKEVRLWRQDRDSINNLILSIDNPDRKSKALAAFSAVNNSIRLSLDRNLDKMSLSFSEYLLALSELSEIDVDASSKELINMITLAYEKSGMREIHKGSTEEVISRYEGMLEKSLIHGFSSLEDVFTFLVQEDVHYRAFLFRLHDLGCLSLENIIARSERIMRDILYLTTISNSPLSKSDAVILMTMRNNRRVLQNAIQCEDDLERNKVRNQERKDAYLWMLIQPFLVLDNFSFALLTEEQYNDLIHLASFLKDHMGELGSTGFPIDTCRLPDILTRELIERYINHF